MPAPKITKTWDYSRPNDENPAIVTITSTEDPHRFKVEASFTAWTVYSGDAESIATERMGVDGVEVEVHHTFVMDGHNVTARATVEAKSFNAAHKLVSGVWEPYLSY